MKVDKSSPIYPPEYEVADAKALQKLAEGNATEAQQKRALDWIIYKACATYDMPYRPGADGARDTDLACGRMFVGQQIVKLLKINLAAIKQNTQSKPIKE